MNLSGKNTFILGAVISILVAAIVIIPKYQSAIYLSKIVPELTSLEAKDRVAVLRHFDLFKANLKGADLVKTELSLANLGLTDLSNALLDQTNLNRADLIGADLSTAHFLKLEQVVMTENYEIANLRKELQAELKQWLVKQSAEKQD